jgi:hypothetical protein
MQTNVRVPGLANLVRLFSGIIHIDGLEEDLSYIKDRFITADPKQ